MLPYRALWAPLVVGILLVAGCFGGGEGLSDDRLGTGGPAQFEETTGAIEGRVMDEESMPLGNVTVGIIGTNHLTLSSPGNGEFRFSNLEPGTYQLAAQRLGYDSAVQRVQVEAGKVTTATFTLKIIDLGGDPWHEVLGPFVGYFNCRVGTPVLTGSCTGVGLPGDQASFGFDMHNETSFFHTEMRWQQGSAATSQQLRISFSYQGRTTSHWFCSSTGNSPLIWMYRVEGRECIQTGSNAQQLPGGQPQEPTPDLRLITYVNTPFGGTSTSNPPLHLALQQRFEIMVTLFQNMEPEPDYTAFPDT